MKGKTVEKSIQRENVCKACVKEHGNYPPCICYEYEWWHYSRLTGCCKVVIQATNSKAAIDDVMANIDKVKAMIEKER